ncbi:MAG: hypothetical protein AAF656_12730, partial [Planctomycetota bacterium]
DPMAGAQLSKQLVGWVGAMAGRSTAECGDSRQASGEEAGTDSARSLYHNYQALCFEALPFSPCACDARTHRRIALWQKADHDARRIFSAAKAEQDAFAENFPSFTGRRDDAQPVPIGVSLKLAARSLA